MPLNQHTSTSSNETEMGNIPLQLSNNHNMQHIFKNLTKPVLKELNLDHLNNKPTALSALYNM